MADFSLSKEDRNQVRDYITAKDSEHYSGMAQDTVAVIVTHSNLPSKFMDLRFDLHATITEVKERFRKHFGTPVDFQRLVLKDGDKAICEMSENHKMLGYYSVESGNVVHVIDEDPYSLSRGGGLTDTSLVQKYQMSEETYNTRKGTVRDYIKEQKQKKALERIMQGGDSSNLCNGTANGSKGNREAAADEGKDSVQHILTYNDSNAADTDVTATEDQSDAACNGGVGARCEVMPGARRGIVRWVGECAELKAGYWVGVQFDEPVGRSNGSVKDVKIFECGAYYGGFLRGKNVKVGDYPERDILDEEEEGESSEGKCCNNIESSGDSKECTKENIKDEDEEM